jgi:hypothetical protein
MIWRPRGLVSTRDPSLYLSEQKTISLIKQGQTGA